MHTAIHTKKEDSEGGEENSLLS